MSDIQQRINDLEHDLSAAMALLEGLRYTHEHVPEGLPYGKGLKHRVSVYRDGYLIAAGEADTAATAFLMAYLEMVEAQNT